MPLAHDHLCDEIVGQTRAAAGLLAGAGLAAPVPTCPGWTLDTLVRHTGGALRWMAHLADIRSPVDVPMEEVPDVGGPPGEGPGAAEELALWLAGSGETAARVLRVAGAGVPVWSWSWEATTGFWARRAVHEALVHRADLALALGRPPGDPPVAPALAADGLDEWLQILAHGADGGDARAPRPAGRTAARVQLHATDVPEQDGQGSNWLLTVGPGRFAWRRGRAVADVTLHGGVLDLLLAAVRRLSPDDARLRVEGEREALDAWLRTATFG